MNGRAKRFLLAVAFIATAKNATAYRFEFFARHNGERVAHAEVCFFAADQPRDIYPRFFASADVRCLSADDVIDVPPGKWNYYVRSGSSLVSDHPAYVTHSGTPRRDAGYKAVNLELVAAATIDLSEWVRARQDGETIFVYADSKNDTLSTAFPLPPEGTTVVVPAGVPLTPVMMRSHHVTRVGSPMVLSPGETHAAPLPRVVHGFADVVFATTLVRTLAGRVEQYDMPPPVFRLRTAKGEIHEPLTSSTNAASLDLTLVVFRNVPVGPATLIVSGDDWESADELVYVTEPMTVLEDVALAPAGHLRLELSGVRSDTPTVSPRVAIFRCEGSGNQSGPCTPFVERELAGAPQRTSFDVGSLPAGAYELRLVNAPSRCWPVLIWPGRESKVVIAK